MTAITQDAVIALLKKVPDQNKVARKGKIVNISTQRSVIIRWETDDTQIRNAHLCIYEEPKDGLKVKTGPTSQIPPKTADVGEIEKHNLAAALCLQEAPQIANLHQTGIPQTRTQELRREKTEVVMTKTATRAWILSDSYNIGVGIFRRYLKTYTPRCFS